MKTRLLAVTLLVVGMCCSCEKKLGPGGGGGGNPPSTIVIAISMDPDPNKPGQCLQQATTNGGPPVPYDTYVPAHVGDFITWTSTFAAAGTKVVFFPNGANSGFPGTPMYDTKTGNWVRGFASGSTSLTTSASLTGPEGSSYNFPYSRVVVLDPVTKQPTSCTPPLPEQGMGVHITN